MKTHSTLPKLLCAIFLFSFSIHSNIQAQESTEFSPWTQKKVKKNLDWYSKKGMDLSNYDWSDSVLNEYLGEIEGSRTRQKIMLIPAINHTLGGLAYYFIAHNIEVNNSLDCPFSISKCDTDAAKRQYNLIGNVNMIITVPF